MYFDAVMDSSGFPYFNGTRREVIEWLDRLSIDERNKCLVYRGELDKVVTVREYLA